MLAHSHGQYRGSSVALVGLSKLHNSLTSSCIPPRFLLASLRPWHLCNVAQRPLLFSYARLRCEPGLIGMASPSSLLQFHLQHARDTASTRHKEYSLLASCLLPRAECTSLGSSVSIRQDQTPASMFVHTPRLQGTCWRSSRNPSVFSSWGYQCELEFLPLAVSGAPLAGFPISMSNSLLMGKEEHLKLLKALMITYQKVYSAF